MTTRRRTPLTPAGLLLAGILGIAGCQPPAPGTIAPSPGATATTPASPAATTPPSPAPSQPVRTASPTASPAASPPRPKPTIEVPPPRNAPDGESAGEVRTDS